MNTEGITSEQHIDPRCSVIKRDDTLIIDLDHSPDAFTSLLFLKLWSGMFILPLLLYLMNFIFEASIVLTACLLMYSPVIFSYFYQKSRKFNIEINRTKRIIRYQKIPPNNKILKFFNIDEITSLIIGKDILAIPTITFSLKFKLRNKRKKKIHTGEKEDLEKLARIISEFLEVPYP